MCLLIASVLFLYSKSLVQHDLQYSAVLLFSSSFFVYLTSSRTFSPPCCVVIFFILFSSGFLFIYLFLTFLICPASCLIYLNRITLVQMSACWISHRFCLPFQEIVKSSLFVQRTSWSRSPLYNLCSGLEMFARLPSLHLTTSQLVISL